MLCYVFATIVFLSSILFAADTGVQVKEERPSQITFDSSGALLVSDSSRHLIERRDPATGARVIVAGGKNAGVCGDDGPANEACLNGNVGIAVSGSGDLVVADTGNHSVRQIDGAGIIRTVVGGRATGPTGGFCGDGGDARLACLAAPTGLAFDHAGVLYIADRGNQRVRRVGADGIITTVAGNGTNASCGDNGPATQACLNQPSIVATDTSDNLFIAEANRVRRVDAVSGAITTVAGNGLQDCPDPIQPVATQTCISPTGLTFDSMGDLLIADGRHHRILKLKSTSGMLSSLTDASQCEQTALQDEGCIASPGSMAFDQSDRLFFVDNSNQVRILSKAIAASAATGATCTPYTPDGGLFINSSQQFYPVPKIPTQNGLYAISIQAGQVIVTEGNSATADAVVNVPVGIPNGTSAFYRFTGANNRFLLLDFRSQQGLDTVYQQAVVDLTAWSAGQPPQSGNFLPPVSLPGAQLSIFPSASYTPGSAGGALAFLVFYGLGQRQISNAGIYRSDNGSQLCFIPSFTASVQVEAKITPTDVEILDGPTPILSFPLPTGSLYISPKPLDFGTSVANTNSTATLTFSNRGNDCLNVTAISSSAHFSPANFASFSIAPVQSRQQSILFNPNGAIGNFTESLTVTRVPPIGDSTVTAKGNSVAPQTTLKIESAVLPTGDPGQFTVQLDGQTVGDSSATIGPQVVTPGNHTVGEIAGPGTILTDYVISMNCGSGAAPESSTIVNLSTGDQKVCRITNLGHPRLTINLVLQPPGGTVNLLVDGINRAINAGNGASTGPLILAPGTHSVSVTSTGSTTLGYSMTISGSCNGSGTVVLVAGDNKVCTVSLVEPPEPVLCYIFNDGYTEVQGPSDSIYISGRPSDLGHACIPDGTSSHGKCAKWFGRCFTTSSKKSVTFNIFGDDDSQQVGPSDALFVPKPEEVCQPNGASGTCRRWFGKATTSDGRAVSCNVFSDGASVLFGPSSAIFIPNPLPSSGLACVPGGSSGNCLRWFGKCQALPR